MTTLLSAKTGSPKAAGGGGANKELVPAKNCSDVEEAKDSNGSDDDDDPDQIMETSPNGRWQKINTEVSKDLPLELFF